MPSRADRDEGRDSARRGRSGGGARWALVAVAVVAIAALGLGGWLLLRPTTTHYTDMQRADAKAKVCQAHKLVSNGVSMNTKMLPPGGEGDVTGTLAVAANARMSLFFGGEYMLARLDPATSQELADQVRTFANNLLDIGVAASAGVQNTDPAQAARLKDTDAINTKILELCK